MCRNVHPTIGGLALALLWLAVASAEELPTAPAPVSAPMAITSRSMTVKNLDHRVVFDHDVTITKGDMDLSADRVEVILSGPADSRAGKDVFAAGAGPNVLSEDNIE